MMGTCSPVDQMYWVILELAAREWCTVVLGVGDRPPWGGGDRRPWGGGGLDKGGGEGT